MNSNDRRARQFLPSPESLEGRVVLSQQLIAPQVELLHNVLFGQLGSQPVRPNFPVQPFAATSNASFTDPTVTILGGTRIAIGINDYVAPQATLDARRGLIEIGGGSIIQDHATIIANPRNYPGGPGVIIGDNVAIGPGATILGPSLIGAAKGAATNIGAGALVDNAIIEPGAAVGALARVGPRLVVPTGFRVLPGVNVTTQDEASNPAFGKVVAYTAPDAETASLLAQPKLLATGYTALFQGLAATGSNSGSSAATVFNGSLAPVEGLSEAPPFTGQTARQGPRFPAPNGMLLEGTNPFFKTRVIGQITFSEYPASVAAKLGRHTSIRSDQGSPITFGTFRQIGQHVTITTRGGSATAAGNRISVGNGDVIADRAVLTSSTANLTVGSDVLINTGAVVDGSTIGNGTSIGSRAYVRNSTVAPGAVIPDGTILVNNKVVGRVAW